MASEGVFVSFSSGGGASLYLASQSEYREPEYLQKWYKIWQNEDMRLLVAKDFQHIRIQNVNLSWNKLSKKYLLPIEAMNAINEEYSSKIDRAQNNLELMGYEGAYTKQLYSILAKSHNIAFNRNQQGDDIINKNLDRNNYLA